MSRARFYIHASALFALLHLASAGCGGPTTIICYDGSNGSTPQNVSLSDIAFAAEYIRYLGQSNVGTSAAFWNMPGSFDCQEWELPTDDDGTVLPLADHYPSRYNSSVLFSDIADAIDGGQQPTAKSKANSLLYKCGANGGQVGVVANTSDSAYNTPAYRQSGAENNNLLVKIVHSPPSSK